MSSSSRSVHEVEENSDLFGRVEAVVNEGDIIDFGSGKKKLVIDVKRGDESSPNSRFNTVFYAHSVKGDNDYIEMSCYDESGVMHMNRYRKGSEKFRKYKSKLEEAGIK
jgi:hypothetical protein|tara:strand:- start:265 stop:591 length:327 start_codon:yes stop_codon:yes gene_type:complete